MKIENMNSEDMKLWYKIYDTAKSGVSPVKASEIADSHMAHIFEKRANQYQSFNAEIKPSDSGDILVRDNEGQYFFDAVLMGTDDNKDGLSFDSGVLESWAGYINENPIIADIDHGTYKDLLKKGNSVAFVKSFLKNKPGIAKSVKAFVEDGKLLVRSWIDKRYKNFLNRIKGLSLECAPQYDESGTKIIGGDILGFTFNVNTEPAYEGAQIVS